MAINNTDSYIHASNSPSPKQQIQVEQSPKHVAIPAKNDITNPTIDHDSTDPDNETDYLSRAQWLRAAVLGANDGLVSVASLMIAVGAVNHTSRAMLISGLAGLVAGACSMAIGEFVSVYAQYDIEMAHMKRAKADVEAGITDEERKSLPSPTQAAAASALAFASGALIPLLAASFITSMVIRLVMVCLVTSVALAGFGAVGAFLGSANLKKGAIRVLLGGWAAMAISYGVLKVFGLALHE